MISVRCAGDEGGRGGVVEKAEQYEVSFEQLQPRWNHC